MWLTLMKWGGLVMSRNRLHMLRSVHKCSMVLLSMLNLLVIVRLGIFVKHFVVGKPMISLLIVLPERVQLHFVELTLRFLLLSRLLLFLLLLLLHNFFFLFIFCNFFFTSEVIFNLVHRLVFFGLFTMVN